MAAISASKALVEKYEQVVKSKDNTQMKNWKRNLTRYCTSREEETGTASVRFRAAVKSQLSKKGYDVSGL